MKYATTYFDDVKVGDELPPVVKGPLQQIQLTKYAGASGDFNPIHQDHEFAKAAGMLQWQNGQLVSVWPEEFTTNRAKWIPLGPWDQRK